MLPWIATATAAPPLPIDQWPSNAPAAEPLASFLLELEQALGEAVLVGLERADPGMAARWAALIEQGEQLGYDRLLDPARVVAAQLDSRRGTLSWDPKAAVDAAIQLAILLTFGVADG